MNRSTFRKVSSTVINVLEQFLSNDPDSDNLTFEVGENGPDYGSGLIGRLYAQLENVNLSFWIFASSFDDRSIFIKVATVFGVPEGEMALYPDINEANNELEGVKVILNEEGDSQDILIGTEFCIDGVEEKQYPICVLKAAQIVLNSLNQMREKGLLPALDYYLDLI